MKKIKIISFFLVSIFVAIALISPNISLAVWWNPATWGGNTSNGGFTGFGGGSSGGGGASGGVSNTTQSGSSNIPISNTSLGGAAVSPVNTSTGCGTSITDLKSLISYFISCLLAPLVYLIIGLAIFIFIFGIFKMITSESPEEKQKGRDLMFWGIIGIFVMISLWGLVSILQNTFVLSNISINPRQVTIPNL
jgi:hypothetical protein